MATTEIENSKSQFATLDNAGVTYTANGDYSVTAARFEWGPPAGEVWHAERLIALISDAGGANSSEYGNLGSALTNGIQVQFVTGTDTVVKTLSGLKPVRTNSDWAGLCFDTTNLGAGASGDDAFAVRWTFSKDLAGNGIRLYGDDSDRISILLNDNLSGLIDHTFFVGGRKV